MCAMWLIDYMVHTAHLKQEGKKTNMTAQKTHVGFNKADGSDT